MFEIDKSNGVYAKIKELGIALPSPPDEPPALRLIRPLGPDMLYVSGVGPNFKGQLPNEEIHGKVGGGINQEEAYLAAQNTALNALAVLEDYLGDLNRVTEFVKLLVLVASVPIFSNQHLVANGASDLLITLYGENVGKSARSAVGVAVLPGDIPVETEMIVRYC